MMNSCEEMAGPEVTTAQGPTPDAPRPANPADQTCELDRFVSGPRLLEILWEPASRPSLRWLRTQTKKRAVPFARSAGRVWFVPRQVRDALTRLEIRRGRPRKASGGISASES